MKKKCKKCGSTYYHNQINPEGGMCDGCIYAKYDNPVDLGYSPQDEYDDNNPPLPDMPQP